MKNPIVLLVLSIITFSCSSIKQDYNVINDFLETELANKKIDTLFLKIKGPNRIEGLKKYEQAFKERNYSKHALRLMWIEPPLNPWPIDSLEIEQLKIKLSEDKIKHWKKTDFSNKKLIITPSNVHNDKEFIQHHLKPDNYVLNISQPFYDKTNSYSFFLYSLNFIFGGGGPGDNNGLIVMKKIDGKWTQVSWIEYEHYN